MSDVRIDNRAEPLRLPQVKREINEGRDLDSRVHECGRTHLHRAAGENQFEIVKTLLNAEVFVDQKDEKGQTALHRACRKGNIEVAKELIGKGASRCARDHQGRSPLMLLMSGGFDGEIDFLIDGDLNQPNLAGETPLHLAASRAKQSWVKALLDAGADPSFKDGKGRTSVERLFENQLPFEKFKQWYFLQESSEQVLENFTRLNPDIQRAVKEVMKQKARMIEPEKLKSSVKLTLTTDPYHKLNAGKNLEISLMGLALLKFKKDSHFEISPCAKLLLSKLDDWTPALQMLLKSDYPNHRFQAERKALITELISSKKVKLDVELLKDALQHAKTGFEPALMLIDSNAIELDISVVLIAAKVGALTVLKKLKEKKVALTGDVLIEAIKGNDEGCIKFLVGEIYFRDLLVITIDDLSLANYTALFAPPGLREALVDKVPLNPTYRGIRKALKKMLLKDLKLFVEKTKLNIKELNELIASLEKINSTHPELHLPELENEIQSFVESIIYQENSRPKGKKTYPLSVPLVDYLRTRSSLGGALTQELVSKFFDPSENAKKFFEKERSLEGLAWLGKTGIAQKFIEEAESNSFKNQILSQYRRFKLNRYLKNNSNSVD